MYIENNGNCTFCSEFTYDGKDSFYINKIAEVNHIKNRILFETDRWLLVPTIGACVENYILMIHKSHTISAAYCNKKDFYELHCLLSTLINYNRIKYQKESTFFEHGTINEPVVSGCCVTHTHIHAIPFEIDIKDDISNFLSKCHAINIFCIEHISQLKDQLSKNKDYIFYQSPNQEKILFEPRFAISQLVRQIIFTRLAIPQRYDWRNPDNFFVENIYSTINNFDRVLFKELFEDQLNKMNKLI